MRRPCSIGVAGLFGPFVAAYFFWGLGACAVEDIVDLGADLDAAESVPDVGLQISQEAGPVRDGALADRRDASTAIDAMDESEPPAMPGAVCVNNFGFEAHLPGDAQAKQPLQPMPPGWQVCSGLTASTSSCRLPATQGDNYVGLSLGFLPFVGPASIDGEFCNALEVGVAYSLSVDVGLDMPLTDSGSATQPPALQIWGATTTCMQQELLGTSYPLVSACMWTSFCMNITPSAPYDHLVLVPETGSDTTLGLLPTYVIVDNLDLSVGACPPERGPEAD